MNFYGDFSLPPFSPFPGFNPPKRQSLVEDLKEAGIFAERVIQVLQMQVVEGKNVLNSLMQCRRTMEKKT